MWTRQRDTTRTSRPNGCEQPNPNTRLANSGKQPVKPKTIKLVFAASPKHTAVGSYSKDWLDQNQEMCLNVFHSVNQIFKKMTIKI